MGIVVVACFVAFGIGSALYGFGRWYWSATPTGLRALRAARPTWIDQVEEGAVIRIEGRVVEGETFPSTLTQTACVYCVATAAKPDSEGMAQEILREVRGAPFTIDDGTGRALVDPTGAIVEVALAELAVGFGSRRQAKELLDRHQQRRDDEDDRPLTFSEGLIRVGDQVSVLCQAIREPDQAPAHGGERGYREAPPTRLRITGSEAQPIVLGNTPENLWPYPRQPPRPRP